MSDLDKEIQELENKTNKLKALKARYPDLQQDVDRWKKVRYTSKSVNFVVDKVEIRHGCGCCNDSPVLVCPYLEIEGNRIYSEPARFYIAPDLKSPYSKNAFCIESFKFFPSLNQA